MTDQVQAIKSLSVYDVKVYETKGEKTSVLTRGKLDVLYIPEYDRFVLRLNGFKYALSRYLPIVATLLEERSFRSYIMPNVNGHYIVKLKSTPAPPIIKNLETIFANYSQFTYKSGQEKQLEDQALHRGDYPTTFGTPYEERPVLHNIENKKEKLMKVGNYLRMGGEVIKQNLIKAASFIDKKVIQPKDNLESQNSNQVNVKNIDELKGFNSTDAVIAHFSRNEANSLITLSNEIERQLHGQPGQYSNKPQIQQGTGTKLKDAAVESAKTIWRGADEAVNILYKGIQAKRVNKKDKENKLLHYQVVEQNGPKMKYFDEEAMTHLPPNHQAVGQINGNSNPYPQLNGPYSMGGPINNSNNYASYMGQQNTNLYTRGV